ncbi:MAG: nickel import ATP-binding protein NikD [Tistrella sp.]|uniref:Nickel import ATP-binding protein NikD n=1 Tax=Tistrella mobilis TaxID=171437 RepID=A0A3B9IQ53_9PROT|nr:ABC transporter ATP-binding protein [Tistrella sp.]MAD40411.1 nickel import ATP-binding protein NikD [Tistrella sp.]MBA74029.1 nickel import ATP-binding protein NikD [Tistrella sp.]HAE50012.1 nickel import ATP-binding protein NikD [Tistrella mobilis]
MTAPLLRVDGLKVGFKGAAPALDGISFDLGAGETLALVGESGSGKSVTALSILGLLPPAATILGGRILFDGADLVAGGEAAVAPLRGRAMSMVFQNPRRALDPLRRVGDAIGDVVGVHAGRRLTRADRAARVQALLAAVGIPDPVRRARAFPHELSGGMCQRVMIAIALAGSPRLLIADEPTTGLDVTTQAVILDLIGDLADARGMATILITHDLAVAAERAHRIVVMRRGRVVEQAPTARLFQAPADPYTKALIRATPGPDSRIGDLVR